MLRSHRHDPPAPLPRIDGLPAEVAEVCAASLDKLPEARPTSVALALILAAAVDVPVHVPPVLLPAPAPAGLHDPTEAISV